MCPTTLRKTFFFFPNKILILRKCLESSSFQTCALGTPSEAGWGEGKRAGRASLPNSPIIHPPTKLFFGLLYMLGISSENIALENGYVTKKGFKTTVI